MNTALPAFAFVGAFVWLVFAILATAFPSKRQGAKLHAKRAAIAMGVSFAVLMVLVSGETRTGSEPVVASVDRPEPQGDDLGVTTGEIARPTWRPEDTSQSASADPAAEDAGPKRLSDSQEFVWIRSNQRLLTAKLRDPDSAQFANDYVSYKGGAPVVCGSVNARNGFGGYTGATPYIGMGESIGVFLSNEVDGFRDLWNRFC